MTFYHDEFQKFHEAMLDFNAWIAVCKSKDITKQMIHLEKLGKSVPDDFLIKDIEGNYTQNYDLSKLNQYFKANPLITNEELNAKKRELIDRDYYKIFRGKYEINFLCELLKHLRFKANHKKQGERVLLEKNILSWDINNSKLMIYFSAFAYYPSQLRDFIKSYVS